MKKVILFGLFLSLTGYLITSCKHKSNAAPQGGFPPEIANILVNKCAVSGCHDQASYVNADGLLTDTWDHLFDGSTNGAVVIPFSPQYSSLLYYCNTDPSLGLVEQATMPLNANPLTKAEYLTLYNWVLYGAPDQNGNIPFASNPDTRQKFYLTNQGCDLMAVIDAQKKVVMRYIPIGKSGPFSDTGALSPHSVDVSSDGMYAYTCFFVGGRLQKIDTRTDQVVGGADLGKEDGQWSVVLVSPKGDQVVASDWEYGGQGLSFVNTSTMQVQTTFPMSYTHGIATNPTFDTLYTGLAYGNTINMLVPSLFDSGFYPIIPYSLDGLPPAVSGSDSNLPYPNPHQLLMTPDCSHYFVTCQGTNQVIIMDPHAKPYYNVAVQGREIKVYYTPFKVINVGTLPQELAVSKKYPYMFVTCMEDQNNPNFGARGSVYVINYNTFEVVKVIYGDFFEPHGIAVDDQDGLLLIASTNLDPSGPLPHHTTVCAGRDGWYTMYDLKTLLPATNRRYEVTVYPYSAAARFK